jgi:CRISPR/Cas system-associated exonuclease Cas4 (RecB family)
VNAVAAPPVKNGRSPAELLAKVSASRLQTFHTCRLKFYFRYVLRLEKPKSPALHVGSAVHFVLQTWNRARWRGEPIDLAILRQVFGSFWVFEQAESPVEWEGESEPKEMEAAWLLARTYLEQTPIPANEKPEAVEVEAEADLSRHGLPTLIGFIDLVRAGGRIVDYKTAAQTPNSERAVHLHELQLSCYGVLYRDATGHNESGFELHHLVKLKTPKLVITEAGPMTAGQEAKLFRAIESYVEGVQREDWVPSPNTMTCACCEYFNECRQWAGKEVHAAAH